MVEHQPRLLGSRVRFPAWAFAIFSVSAKASLPISLSLFPFLFLSFSSSSFPFLFLSLRPCVCALKKKRRLCVRLRSGDKHHLRKSADRKAQISSVSGTNLPDLCFSVDLQIFSGGVYPPSATSRTISFLLTHNLLLFQ